MYREEGIYIHNAPLCRMNVIWFMYCMSTAGIVDWRAEETRRAATAAARAGQSNIIILRNLYLTQLATSVV